MPDEKTLGETDIHTVVDIPYGGKKNVVMDATVLTAVMNCPRLSDFRFNHNFQSIDGKSNSLECGSIVHTFLEFYYNGQSKGLSRNAAESLGFAAAEMYIRGCKYCTDFIPSVCECASQNESGIATVNANCPYCLGKGVIDKPTCGHKVDQFPGVTNTPRVPDMSNPREKFKTGWEWVLETIKQYIDHYRSDHWVTLETEVVKGKVLYEDDEVRVLWKAKLDWLVDTNQGIYPVDHKTMKQNRSNVSLNNQFIGQCLVSDTQRMFINKIGFQKTLKPEEKFHRDVMSYPTARLIEWQSEILPYYAKLLVMYAESGYFPPNFTNCESKFGFCAFKGICESTPDMREEELKLHFKVGKEWNPTNDDMED